MKSTARSSVCATSSSGFTLVETLLTGAVSLLLIASIVALGIYAAQSFSVIRNYLDLDAQSRNAADVLGQQIRDANALLSYSSGNSTNFPYLELTNFSTRQAITVTYNSTASTLTLAETGQPTETLLTGCTNWAFALYNRAPITNSFGTDVDFYPATNAAMCKLIDMSWECTRTLLGSRLNSQSVQTAQIVLRNQISN